MKDNTRILALTGTATLGLNGAPWRRYNCKGYATCTIIANISTIGDNNIIWPEVYANILNSTGSFVAIFVGNGVATGHAIWTFPLLDAEQINIVWRGDDGASCTANIQVNFFQQAIKAGHHTSISKTVVGGTSAVIINCPVPSFCKTINANFYATETPASNTQVSLRQIYNDGTDQKLIALIDSAATLDHGELGTGFQSLFFHPQLYNITLGIKEYLAIQIEFQAHAVNDTTFNFIIQFPS